MDTGKIRRHAKGASIHTLTQNKKALSGFLIGKR
jgi:hypothetical protein